MVAIRLILHIQKKKNGSYCNNNFLINVSTRIIIETSVKRIILSYYGNICDGGQISIFHELQALNESLEYFNLLDSKVHPFTNSCLTDEMKRNFGKR